MVLQIYLAVSGTGTAAMLPSIPHASTPAFIGSFKKGPAAAAGRAGQRVGEERDAFEGGFYKKSAHTFNIKAGAPGANTANDVRTYTRDEVRAGARQLFDELGDEGFQVREGGRCYYDLATPPPHSVAYYALPVATATTTPPTN
jgi:hypothetical protein